MHFVAGDAGELASTKTRRRFYAVEFASGHANHSITPEPIAEKIRLGAADEILLFAVILRIWLNNETLPEILLPGTEIGTVPVEIDFIRHVVKCPDAVALAAVERGSRSLQARGVRHGRVGF